MDLTVNRECFFIPVNHEKKILHTVIGLSLIQKASVRWLQEKAQHSKKIFDDVEPGDLQVWRISPHILEQLEMDPDIDIGLLVDDIDLDDKESVTRMRLWERIQDREWFLVQGPKVTDTFGELAQPGRQALKASVLAEAIKNMKAQSKAGQPAEFHRYLATATDEKTGKEPTFLCNRPIDYNTIPIELLHPVFASFRDIIWGNGQNEPMPTIEDKQNARRLSTCMSAIFKDETDREEHFHKWFFNTFAIHLEKEYAPVSRGTERQQESDGHAFAPLTTFLKFICECKGEPFWQSSEPRYQGCVRIAQFFAGSSDAQSHFEHSPLPVILLTLEGPFLQVHGVVVHPDGAFQIRILMPPLALNCDWRSLQEDALLARFVLALRVTLESLDSYYMNLKSGTGSPPYSDHILISRGLHRSPYPHEYTATVSGKRLKFTYDSCLLQGGLLFEAREVEGKLKLPIIVKFTRTYSRRAHELLAKDGMAPQILGFDELPSGWIMVVMESLLRDEDGWSMLESVPQEERGVFKLKVQEGMAKLHEGGYVHGDLRACNILVRMQHENDGGERLNAKLSVKFVDFDESGPPETTVYPPYWNTETVNRPHDAKEGDSLQFEHDILMLEEIFDRAAGHLDGTGIT